MHMRVRRLKGVAELLPILNQRLHLSRCLACLVVRVRRACFRELRQPGAAAAVKCLCEDQLRVVGFKF